jgi:dUTP pyrophosphatase
MNQPFVIRPGYRIAQLILENFTVAEVVETSPEGTRIPSTARGDSGFGSTGL